MVTRHGGLRDRTNRRSDCHGPTAGRHVAERRSCLALAGRLSVDKLSCEWHDHALPGSTRVVPPPRT